MGRLQKLQQSDVSDMVVVAVPSIQRFDMPAEAPPPNVAAPPPAIIAQAQPPIAVAVTPFAFEGPTAIPDPPEPTKYGDASYSQALKELADLYVAQYMCVFPLTHHDTILLF